MWVKIKQTEYPSSFKPLKLLLMQKNNLVTMFIAHLIWGRWTPSYDPVKSLLEGADARLRLRPSSARAHLVRAGHDSFKNDTHSNISYNY